MTVVQTQVERVTLYQNGALVERVGRSARGAVEVANLPLLLSWSTLRIRPALGEVSNITERASMTFAGADAAKDDDDETHALGIKIETLKAKVQSYQALEKRLRFAAEASTLGKDVARELAPMPHWGDLPGWIEAEALRLNQQKAEAERALEIVERERARLWDREMRVAAPARASRGATFELKGVPDDIATPFTVEYFVPAARWVPTYALDLVGDRGQLTLFAMVANATGEEWTGARLSFSTVDLARETTLPEVLSWRIGRAQDKRRPAYRPLPSGFDALFDAYDHGRRRATTADAPPSSGGGGPMLPPEPSSAIMMGGVSSEARKEEAFDGSGVEEFETHESELMLSEESDLYDEEDAFEVEGAPLMAQRSAAAPPLASVPMSAPPPPGAAPKMKKSAFGGGMSRSRVAAAAETITAGVSEPLPPSLRTMSMVLDGPDGPQRGRLQLLREQEHLASLVGPEGADAVHLALHALQRAAAGLWSRPVPHGTQMLDDTTPPAIFEGETKASVPDDGEFHRVAVKQMGADGRAELRVVPRESTDVFRFFLFDLEPGVALPSGPLDVTEGGTFRVRSRLTTTGTSRQLQLNLGVEPGLRVLGRVARVRQEEKGIMNAASLIEHSVELTLRNTLPDSVRLRVYDRIPVPGHNEKEIEVDLTQSTPSCARTDKAPNGDPLEGGIEWSLVVESGETFKVEHAYQIKLPAKSEVVGGNRRE